MLTPTSLSPQVPQPVSLSLHDSNSIQLSKVCPLSLVLVTPPLIHPLLRETRMYMYVYMYLGMHTYTRACTRLSPAISDPSFNNCLPLRLQTAQDRTLSTSVTVTSPS